MFAEPKNHLDPKILPHILQNLKQALIKELGLDCMYQRILLKLKEVGLMLKKTPMVKVLPLLLLSQLPPVNKGSCISENVVQKFG